MQRLQDMWVWSLGQEDPLEEEMATYSSILTWRIPWTEEPGGLQSIESQKGGHNWSDWGCTRPWEYGKWILSPERKPERGCKENLWSGTDTGVVPTPLSTSPLFQQDDQRGDWRKRFKMLLHICHIPMSFTAFLLFSLSWLFAQIYFTRKLYVTTVTENHK